MTETLPSNVEVGSSAPADVAHGIEAAVEFKPVEHPTEPVNRDQPVRCPLPEPSILNVSINSISCPDFLDSFCPFSIVDLIAVMWVGGVYMGRDILFVNN